MPPLPLIVCATGIDCASAKRVSAVQASDRWMPPPVSSSGRLALAISFAARSISARSGRMRRAGAFSVASSMTKSSGAKSWVPWRDVLGHVEQHRPWPPRGRHREGAPHQLGDAAGHLDANQLLDRGLEDFDLAAFLGHVLPGMRAVGVAGDRDDRDAAIQRLDEPGDEVGRAGAERAVANAGAVGDPGIGVRGEGAAALVVDQVVVQADQADRVVERQQLEPAHAEHRPGARRDAASRRARARRSSCLTGDFAAWAPWFLLMRRGRGAARRRNRGR